jgi:hypothetical protein
MTCFLRTVHPAGSSALYREEFAGVRTHRLFVTILRETWPSRPANLVADQGGRDGDDRKTFPERATPETAAGRVNAGMDCTPTPALPIRTRVLNRISS